MIKTLYTAYKRNNEIEQLKWVKSKSLAENI